MENKLTDLNDSEIKMNLFYSKIKKKHIEKFELKVANLLFEQFPQFKKVIEISKIHEINFTYKPIGISITRGYYPDSYQDVQKEHRTHFNLTGILIYNKKIKDFEPIKLNYSYDSLAWIETQNPKKFHVNFDLARIKLNDIVIKDLPLTNPDKEITVKILKKLTEEQLNLLELENTFEIEFDEKTYYTILDMEDGNYIAVDKLGAVYRLNHDHNERIRKIADKPMDFFKFYNGTKSELEDIMNK